MSRESHRAFLEEAARKAAARERARRQQERMTAADLGKVKIQTVEPWKRGLLGVLGLSACGGGVGVGNSGRALLGGVLVVLGVLLFLLGVVGRRRTIDAVFTVVDLSEILAGIVDLLT